MVGTIRSTLAAAALAVMLILPGLSFAQPAAAYPEEAPPAAEAPLEAEPAPAAENAPADEAAPSPPDEAVSPPPDEAQAPPASDPGPSAIPATNSTDMAPVVPVPEPAPQPRRLDNPLLELLTYLWSHPALSAALGTPWLLAALVYWGLVTSRSRPVPAPTSPGELVDALPFLARDANSLWSRSHALRDRAYLAMQSAAEEAGKKVLINKSPDFNYPTWVTLEAWLPVGREGARERVFLAVDIHLKPHLRYEYEYRIRWIRHGRTRQRGPFVHLADDTAKRWARFVLGAGGGVPTSLDTRLLRIRWWQIWRPRNPHKGLLPDPLPFTAITAVAVGALFFNPMALPALAILVFCAWRAANRPILMINAGRPIAEPRNTKLLDSWQTMALGLGPDLATVRSRLETRFREGEAQNIASRIEDIAYVTPDGKQERQQLVLSQGRGLVFCHVYVYDQDVFIGWDAHLNFGEWRETKVIRGFDRALGRPVVVHSVAPGVVRATEYDLIDLASLIEWVHARVTQVTKLSLEERKLDQEIDFKITRGERQSLFDDPEAKEGRRPLFRRATPPR